MPQWLEVFGRFHPLVLHLPIGLLLGLAAFEIAAARRRMPREAVRLLAWLAAASAILAAVTGFTLSREEGYGGRTLDLHLWLGIAVAAGTLLAAVFHSRNRYALYRLFLVLTLATLVPAGHFGGTMTHGEGFLTRPLLAEEPQPDSVRPPPDSEPAGASSYVAVVAPIFEARCSSCHGASRHKGGLILNTREGITSGGESGPILVAGRPEASEIVRRLELPIDDEDHMPPEGKTQPKAEEIAAIKAWIAAGAPFDGVVGALASAPAASTGGAAPAPKPKGPPAAEDAALAALRDHLVHVQPLAGDSNLLWIDFAGAPRSGDAEVAGLLSPVSEQVADLSLSRCAVTAASMSVIARMPNLERLDLRGTAMTDAGLEALRSHPRIAELVLVQTRLSDGAGEILASLPALRQVHVWQSGMSKEALARLQERRPDLRVNAGEGQDAAAVEKEPEIKLSGDAPIPGGTAAVVSLEPINATCPVSGSVVDPKFAVVHKGRVVGFCCPNCPGQFWADPGKFEGALPQ